MLQTNLFICVRGTLFAAGLTVLLAMAQLPAAYAQTTSGTISGTVADQSGGLIPGATVTVRNLDTGVSRTLTTGADGRFSFPNLLVGTYELTAEVTGFTRYVRGPIHLLLNQVAIINPELRPAPVQETITVIEDAPLINTQTVEVGVRFDEKRLTDVPTLPVGNPGEAGGFRDVFGFVLSAPGVSQLNRGNSSFSNGTDFSVNGMRQRSNNFVVDGQDSNDISVTGRAQMMNNPDIVQELRLVTSQPLAEYGRAAGSIVSVITKSGSNNLHGSAFWFHNNNQLNSLSNLDNSAGFKEAPWRIENQFGGTLGGPIRKDKTFFFGSLMRWTDRQLGTGVTISGVPTEAGKQTIQQAAGTRPQVAALLKHLPAAQNTRGNPISFSVGGQTFQVPVGDLTSSTSVAENNWQWSGRLDHYMGPHQITGRFLFSDQVRNGDGQVTPPGLTSVAPLRNQALSVSLNSSLTPRLLSEARIGWQRVGTSNNAQNQTAEEIPSLEVTQLGLSGFNSATNRTAVGLAANLPQFRYANTYQIQENISWMAGPHAVKFGLDLRRQHVKSFFFPIIRGLLRYTSLQTLVDGVAEAANINVPLPGGQAVNYYEWDDYYFFVQDTWNVTQSLTLNLGLRYETPGNPMESLYALNERILSANGGSQVFRVEPRPERDKNNFQPRFGFSWNPRGAAAGPLGWLTGGDLLVLRGGYARTNDYGFLNLPLNVASSFPFVAAINNSNLPNAFAVLPTLRPDLSNPAALNLLTRTVVDQNYRAPIAEQFTLEIQRQLASDTVFRIGYVGTKGTGLFQTIDGNPRTNCVTAVPNCPRVDPSRGVIRLRANAASSIYHSMQVSLDRRFTRGITAGAHYTWSAFIDDASEVFNPSVRGEVAVSQDSFNRRADRGRATYDRPHRFTTNFVYELPFFRDQQGALGRIAGGWQVSSNLTFQSGSPYTPLNGVDPAGALAGIDALVGNAIRPNLNTTQDVSSMNPEELLAAGGRSLFQTITAAERVGNAGRNILRSDGIAQLDISLAKNFRVMEGHNMQFRADFFNFTNTRNFAVPESRVNNAGFGNQWGTDGGNRRIFMSLRYSF